MKTIGVDVGGTFTDVVLCDLDSGEVMIHKVLTTPDDPSDGVLRAVTEVCAANGVGLDHIDFVLHGTTTATNAVLEYKGARAGMVTNAGFRDVLHIARHQRVDHYSIVQELPWQARPLIRRRFRKTVRGRLVPPRGDELEPLDEDAVRQAARELRKEGVEAVAVCLLFSYLNPRHEEAARAIIAEEMPDAFITTSSNVAPQFREFERFTTTALAAFIGPKIGRYVHQLGNGLRGRGVRGELRIMASNGGVVTPETAIEKPALTLLSGLAAGVMAGAWIGEQAGRRRLISLDIGGTSADIGIINDGHYTEADARSSSIGGFPLLLPMIDVHTIGAGGGSIAYVDRGGAFRVGPQSAGANPGPAAYRLGGIAPTVTDANVVLGRLDPDAFLGGGMQLDADAAHRVVAGLAEHLQMDALNAAEGILTVINSNMANAIRSRTVQKGLDPREFALVAMGGAGPLHGVDIAKMLGIPEVIVPPFPGIGSAMGLLTTDLKYDAIRTQFQVRGAVDLARLNTDLTQMEATIAAQFRVDRIAEDQVTFVRHGDLRYLGQGYELKVPFPGEAITDAALEEVWRAYHAAHQAEYGHAFEANPIEIVNVRVTGIGRMPKIGRSRAPIGGSLEAAQTRIAKCLFRTSAGLSWFETPFYQRRLLPQGVSFVGPAVVLQQDSTTVIPPGDRALVDESGNILVSVGGV